MWPGFGENLRVLKWIMSRIDETGPSTNAVETPIGYTPKLDSLDLDGLNFDRAHLEALFKIDKKFWLDEAQEISDFFNEYVSDSTPVEMWKEIENLNKRIQNF